MLVVEQKNTCSFFFSSWKQTLLETNKQNLLFSAFLRTAEQQNKKRKPFFFWNKHCVSFFSWNKTWSSFIFWNKTLLVVSLAFLLFLETKPCHLSLVTLCFFFFLKQILVFFLFLKQTILETNKQKFWFFSLSGSWNKHKKSGSWNKQLAAALLVLETNPSFLETNKQTFRVFLLLLLETNPSFLETNKQKVVSC